METSTTRIAGTHAPAYLNGRTRGFLHATLGPSKPGLPAPISFATASRKRGVRLGEGVPFADLYMMRAKKKAALRAAAQQR